MNMQASLCGLLLMALAGASALAAGAEPGSQTLQQAPATRELRPSTTVRAPAAKPPEEAHDQTVDMEMVLKNQLRRCEEDAMALDAENDDLRQQVQTLVHKVDGLKQQNAKLQYKLDETTHPGGSLVTAYCESNSVSRNTAGDVSDCGSYSCEPVSGLCRTVCDVASECREASGGSVYVCDSANRQCVLSQ